MTFASLNSDLSFLKNTVAVLNMTRNLVFLLANIMIFIYYSNAISYINAATILILAPYPFIYKCITPRQQKNRRLVSHGLKYLLKSNDEMNCYSELNRSRITLRNSITAIALLLTIGLVFLIILQE